MSKPTTHDAILGVWQRLLAPLQELPSGLEHLAWIRDRLATMLARAVEVTMLQAGLAADKQELSQELQALFVEGAKVATTLRVNIKEHYGTRAEQLTAFGIQPFRGRRPVPAPEPVPGEIAAPPPDDQPIDL